MSYLVLARKWRPQKFSEMVGQEHILQALINSLEQERVHHAYLFTGTRGVGKTSIARLLAKALNCQKGISATPCETCQNCQDINNLCFPDLIEIDAASRTKVEDTREILDNVQYSPTIGRYKIYLIDEVHMLSGHSFNALLKTLEEPPEHVKFLLATTDPQKLPVTILSRCLQFHLKNMLPEQITQHLEFILSEEKIDYETAALSLIARAANGSMRDALSILDQSIAYDSNKIQEINIRKMLGYIDEQYILQLLSALKDNKGEQILKINQQLVENGADFFRVVEELLSTLHKITILQCVPELNHQAHELNSIATEFNPEDIQLFYQIALKGSQDLPLAPTPAIGFDMIMLRMLCFRPLSSPKPDKQSSQQNQELKNTTPKKELNIKHSPETTITHTPVNNIEDNISNNWHEIIPKLNLSGIAHAAAKNITIENIQDNNITIATQANNQSLLTPAILKKLENALSDYLSKDIKLNLNITSKNLNTPAAQDVETQQKQLNNATQSLHDDVKLNKILDLFDAKIVEKTIEPNK